MAYFVITCDEDGGHVHQMSRDELEEALNPGGSLYIEPGCHEALTEITEPDINYWGYSFLIIKGEIAVPKTKKVVTRTVI